MSIKQAFNNKKHCDYSVILCKVAQDQSKKEFTRLHILKPMGIGLIEIPVWKAELLNIAKVGSENMIDLSRVYSVFPKRNDRNSGYIESKLFDEQKQTMAGAVSGQVSTAFKRAMDNVKEYIYVNGPATIGELFDNIEHHYKQKSSLSHGMRKYCEFLYFKDQKWHVSEEAIDKGYKEKRFKKRR